MSNKTRSFIIAVFTATVTISVIVGLFVGPAFSLQADNTPRSEPTSTNSPQAQITSLEHPQTIKPNETFNIIVETTDSAGVVVEMQSTDFDPQLTSPNAVVSEGNRLEFLDTSRDDSLYVIQVSTNGASEGDVSKITVWTNAAEKADAEDQATTAIEVGSNFEDGSISSLEYPESVEPNGTFNLTIETVETAGTVIELAPNGFSAEITTQEAQAVNQNDGRIEFLDPSNTNSSYQVQVNITGGAEGDVGKFSTWVDAGDVNSSEKVYGSFTISDQDNLPPVVGGSPPKDVDNDGTFEDINGDGRMNVIDVQAFFSNLDNDAIQNQLDAFDYNGDSSVDVIDVQALFNQL